MFGKSYSSAFLSPFVSFRGPLTCEVCKSSVRLSRNWSIHFSAGSRKRLFVDSSLPKLFCTVAQNGVATYGGIQHAGIIVSDLNRSLDFYVGVLGMEDDSHLRNPKLPFGGAFVKVGATQIHLMVADNLEIPEPSFRENRPAHGGRDYHLAMTVDALEPLERRLREKGIPFTMSRSGRRALFCRDPDGNALEFIETPALRTSSS
ncbi:hypothetical protein, conserved [Cyanidioschyzon merolae strain 10D]|jgi:glyoxylase I family protein|uniref:VOC domain-containing protein n=1 Tax=Cyanidioschyzon merolae (strain NIES-3377 / 10D) TaxID=280699 RepID=M1V9Z3_CYAM1|nr:hypothetical protein, conserved [Cyanidioschyzon merolae strain 10D]BAM81814.1 hypothetical protein, conserved [Cyanidioschyzon merolae strain 10D]|eukprot:XP_005537850.1 hypothetical protein, conserved [Cyanidioschyzon merolae strain 10D]